MTTPEPNSREQERQIHSPQGRILVLPTRRFWSALGLAAVVAAVGATLGASLEQLLGLPLYWAFSRLPALAGNTNVIVEAVSFAVVLLPPFVAAAILLAAARSGSPLQRIRFVVAGIATGVGGAYLYLLAIHGMGIAFGAPPPP